MRIARALLVSAVLIAAGPSFSATPEGRQFRPKDECLHIASYIDMRRKFEDIVRRKDASALLAMTYSDIGLEIGGASGKAEFARRWQLAGGQTSPIWAELDQILRLGCYAESDRQVLMPHMLIQDPHWGPDRSSEKALVLGEGINLRARPAADGAVKAVLSWEFVELADGSSAAGWTPVKSRSGQTGYIRSDFLRDYLDYRVGFIREGKVWSLNLMQAGD